MDIDTLGFAIGLIGAVLVKASAGSLNKQPVHVDLEKSMGRDPENPALKTFIRGVGLVLAGLGLETYARIFLP
jgi:hypothetical protein